jgi:hypothetical protein
VQASTAKAETVSRPSLQQLLACISACGDIDVDRSKACWVWEDDISWLVGSVVDFISQLRNLFQNFLDLAPHPLKRHRTMPVLSNK